MLLPLKLDELGIYSFLLEDAEFVEAMGAAVAIAATAFLATGGHTAAAGPTPIETTVSLASANWEVAPVFRGALVVEGEGVGRHTPRP